MKTLKRSIIFSLFALLPMWSFCQPIYNATPSNLSSTVADIMQTYGSQININSNDIENFLFPGLQNSVGPDLCPPPVPQIQQIGGGSITLSWPPITSASSYNVLYLNLDNGSSGNSTTMNPGITLNGLSGTYLIALQTNCGESDRSGYNIIIVDVDVLFPNGDNLQFCNCSIISDTDLLYDGDAELAPDELEHVWIDPVEAFGPKACGSRRYVVSVEGTDEFGPYLSELVFTRKPLVNSVVLNSACDFNATSSAMEPYYVGSSEDLASVYYSLQFNTDNLLITLPPETGFNLNKMEIDVCTCEEASPILGRKAAPLSNQFSAFPNPSSQQTQLQYELAETTEVEILIHDALGRLVERVLPSSIQEKGEHRIEVDMSQWPSGWYTCQLSSPKFYQTLSLQKQ